MQTIPCMSNWLKFLCILQQIDLIRSQTNNTLIRSSNLWMVKIGEPVDNNSMIADDNLLLLFPSAAAAAATDMQFPVVLLTDLSSLGSGRRSPFLCASKRTDKAGTALFLHDQLRHHNQRYTTIDYYCWTRVIFDHFDLNDSVIRFLYIWVEQSVPCQL